MKFLTIISGVLVVLGVFVTSACEIEPIPNPDDTTTVDSVVVSWIELTPDTGWTPEGEIILTDSLRCDFYARGKGTVTVILRKTSSSIPEVMLSEDIYVSQEGYYYSTYHSPGPYHYPLTDTWQAYIEDSTGSLIVDALTVVFY